MDLSLQKALDVYSLPIASNVCQQELREVVSFPSLSIAHVSMHPGASSLLHLHEKMDELYLFFGQGVIQMGDFALKTKPGQINIVGKGVRHRVLANRLGLEHLVIAIPPFNPADVKLVNGEIDLTNPLESFGSKSGQFGDTTDYEVLNEESRNKLGIGLTWGYIPHLKRGIFHKHTKSDQLYYFASGHGNMSLGNKFFPVKQGSFVYVPKEIIHKVDNMGETPLGVASISIPYIQKTDFIKTD